MKNQYSINAYAFNTAWELSKRKDNNFTFSQCLTLGWNAAKLFKKLSSDVTQFTFVKSDKSLRLAEGTRNRQILIDRFKLTFEPSRHRPKVKSFSVIEYFDFDKELWRSFRVDRLQA